MKNIALGRYIPLNSIIHKLDPRLKIISMFALMTAIFLVGGNNVYWAYGFVAIVLISAILTAKLTLNFILKSMKPMVVMLVFLIIINVFQIKTGYVLLELGSFKIYTGAIHQTLFIVLRL